MFFHHPLLWRKGWWEGNLEICFAFYSSPRVARVKLNEMFSAKKKQTTDVTIEDEFPPLAFSGDTAQKSAISSDDMLNGLSNELGRQRMFAHFIQFPRFRYFLPI